MDTAYSLSDIASAMGNNDGFGGANAWVLIILFALIFGNGGFGGLGNNGQTASTADIQRAVDLNSIQEGQNGINSNVQRVAYENMSAIKDAQMTNLSEIRDNGSLISAGNANIINSLTGLQANMQNCCCTTQRAIDSVNYNLATQSAAIQSNDTANTQKILDAISTNRIADMQNQINQLQLQNAVAGVVRYPSASTYYAGNNPYCGGSIGNI